MPTRFVKESCRSSKNLDRISDFEERLFWRLITTADDYGRFLACPELVRAACFPYKSMAPVKIKDALLSLQANHLITLYSGADREYGVFNTWEKHQGKPRAKMSKFPSPSDVQQNHMLASANICMHPLADVTGHTDTDTDTNTDLISLNSLSESEEEFEVFWSRYPKQIGKKAARLAWDKAKDRPSITEIIESVCRAKLSTQWTKDGGQFIPHPATWINQGRWDDQQQAKPLSVMERFLARHQEEA